MAFRRLHDRVGIIEHGQILANGMLAVHIGAHKSAIDREAFTAVCSPVMRSSLPAREAIESML
jgi:hypothetical protein